MQHHQSGDQEKSESDLSCPAFSVPTHGAYPEYWVTFSGIKHRHYLSVLISILPHNSCAGLCHTQKLGINEEERSQSHTCDDLEHRVSISLALHCHFLSHGGLHEEAHVRSYLVLQCDPGLSAHAHSDHRSLSLCPPPWSPLY